MDLVQAFPIVNNLPDGIYILSLKSNNTWKIFQGTGIGKNRKKLCSDEK